MNKKRIINIIIIIVCLVISAIAILQIRYVWPSSPLKGKGTPILGKYDDVVMRIEKKKDCIQVSLRLYEDNTYELFTEYGACRPFQECIMRLGYTKSIKGTYDYDLTKILDSSIEEASNDSIDHRMVDYEILPGTSLGGKALAEKYDQTYYVLKDKPNKYLEEFLNTIDVDLDMCALPDYNQKKGIDTSFEIETNTKEYSLLQSDIQGIPFKIKCNGAGVEVETDGGSIVESANIELDKKGTMIVKCNTTIYWSPLDDDKKEKDLTNIKFYSLDHKNFKEYKIGKNNNKYYVINN